MIANEPTPSDVYFDTSIVVAAMINGLAHHGPANAFCETLVAARSRVYFSRLLRIEFLNVLRNFATRDYQRSPASLRAQYNLANWRNDEIVRARWMQFGQGALQTFLAQFEDVIELSLRPEVWVASIEIIVKYDLNSNDATHIATARTHRIDHFATTDRDFARLSGTPRIWLARDV
jgi:predicted nucleic acid-binding protein